MSKDLAPGFIKVLDAHSINRIFSGCPSLQEFYMRPLRWYEADPLSISGPSLRKLKLGKGYPYGCRPMAFVAVVAPLLQCFHYTDKLAEHYSIKTSNYLVEAHLDTSGDFDDHVDLSAVSNSARDLVQGVSNVKRLFLSAYCIEALALLKDDFPILLNLTKLEIGCSRNPHLTLPRLLRSTPNLEVLTFSEGLFPVGFEDKDTVQQDYWGGQPAPSCLKTHLKVIEIDHFLGLKEELRIIDFLLRKGHALDQLIINKCLGSVANFKARKQLKRMAKFSKKCVKFNEQFL
ncbi:putative F-box protein At1g58310 [Silene latifolia]|uniref:putative F-box protein At1g58310 n=1 Tax=Silene latifolia TaxID=37657 RepID=UPI003D785550